jgi:AraC family transcriptional regulator
MKPSTERDYARRIARVIEAIVADPGAPHTVDSLAAVAHLSPYHFHRIYRALTGESIAATVQRVRLAQAAHGLARADDSVTSIALEAGYDSPQAFAPRSRRRPATRRSHRTALRRGAMPAP